MLFLQQYITGLHIELTKATDKKTGCARVIPGTDCFTIPDMIKGK